MHLFLQSPRRAALLLAVLSTSLFSSALAHPLGQVRISHFVRVETGSDRARIRYVVDLAETPSFQEVQIADANQNGSLSQAKRTAYLDRVSQRYVAGLKLRANGAPVELKLSDKRIEKTPGIAGLVMMKMVVDVTGKWPMASSSSQLRLQNINLADRVGWRELNVTPMTGVSVFDSTAFGNGLPDREKSLSLSDGKPMLAVCDWFAELIAVSPLVPLIILIVFLLAFVFGGKFIKRIPGLNKWPRVASVMRGVVITVLGAVICWQVLRQTGMNLGTLWKGDLEEAKSVSAIAILGLGLVIGLRHALDTDHLAAVSTMVSERKNLFSSLLIGGLWGVGHTVSLLITGIAVIFLNLKLEKYEKPLEFCVALMLIGLGANVLIKLARGGKIHLHKHEHDGHQHVHPHLHDAHPKPESNTHHGFKLSFRPLAIGMVHGLAGSAALMLAALATIKSTGLAFVYIIIFGIGSIGGMMVMSLLLSLPMHLATAYFTRTNFAVRALSGIFSLGFGLFMAYEIGFVGGLFR